MRVAVDSSRGSLESRQPDRLNSTIASSQRIQTKMAKVVTPLSAIVSARSIRSSGWQFNSSIAWAIAGGVKISVRIGQGINEWLLIDLHQLFPIWSFRARKFSLDDIEHTEASGQILELGTLWTRQNDEANAFGISQPWENLR